eukprot:gene9363-19419_t
MGFSHFWRFIKEFGDGVGIEEEFNWVSEQDIASKPWIIIDWSNICMNKCLQVGGHLALLERQTELFFGALARSGARICVIRDGKYHTDERTVIKLGRTHSSLVESVDPHDKNIGAASELMDSNDLAPTMTFGIAEKAFYSVFGGWSSNRNAMYIYKIANGEADPEIREFVRDKIKEDKKVKIIIMSEDASLILGIPSDNLSVTKFECFTLQLRNPNASLSVDNVVLKGIIYPIQNFLTRLTRRSSKVLWNEFDLGSKSTVTDEMLPWIAAVLDGETARIRRSQFNDPKSILIYLKKFLLPRDDNRKSEISNDMLDLFVAVVLIRAWKKHTGSTANDFNVCLAAIRNNALDVFQIIQQPSHKPKPQQYPGRGRGRGRGRGSVLHTPPTPPPLIYGLHSSAADGYSLHHAASDVLNRFESYVPLAHLQYMSGDNNINFDDIRRGDQFKVNFQGLKTYYKGSISCKHQNYSVGISYNIHNTPVQVGYPKGLSDINVMHAMADEVNNRRLASLDKGPTLIKSYETKWGNWTRYKSLDEDTEALLSPLESLSGQLYYINSNMHAEWYISSENDWNERLNTISEDTSRTVKEFNKYLHFLKIIIEANYSYKKNDDHAVVCIRTSKVSLPFTITDTNTFTDTDTDYDTTSTTSTSSLMPLYTIAELHNDFVSGKRALPSNGVIVTSHSDKFGLRFRTCARGDPIDREGAYCRNDAGYLINSTTTATTSIISNTVASTSTTNAFNAKYAGPLLNLSQRAVYIDRLIRNIVCDATREGDGTHGNETDGEGSVGLVSPGLVRMSPADHVVSDMFDCLGLGLLGHSIPSSPSLSLSSSSLSLSSSVDTGFRSRVDIACVAIANCWLHLPCDETSRTYLVSANPATDTAKVMFALIYSFIALLGPSIAERPQLRLFSENLVAKVTTALLLSPLFAIYAMSVPTADGTLRPQKVNPLSAMADFSVQLRSLTTVFPVTGATKATDRLVDLLETVLYHIHYMLYDKAYSGWTSHFRWFDVSGVQYVLGLQENSDMRKANEESIVSYLCRDVNSVLSLNMDGRGEMGEDGYGIENETYGKGPLGPMTIFISVVEAAVGAIVAALDGFM